MTALIVTPSRDRGWVRALTTLRARGVAAVVVLLDARSYQLAASGRTETEADRLMTPAQEQRAIRFALAEYGIRTYEVHAGDSLGTVLA